ncbi:MAG: TenA family protein [Rhodospirillaceae bacterium]|nr:TenA family protein [Rhodospirillaceae bacterium]
MSRFTDTAWQDTSVLRQRIIDLPFNRELMAGTLSQERFQGYMIQDALYLGQYSRTLAIASARSPDPEAMARFARAAEEALVVERALHGGFFQRFGIDPATAGSAEPSPTCAAYTNFLLATAQIGTYGELVAAILPCFWIYWEVGHHIAARPAPDNPFQAWIDTYADKAFEDAVEAMIAITDRAAAATTDTDRARMLNAFRQSTRYEWMFWDSAYRQETWPVAIG